MISDHDLLSRVIYAAAPQRSKDATPTLHVATFPSAVSSSSGSSTSMSTPTPGSMYMPAYHYQPSSTVYTNGSWPYQMCQVPSQQIPYAVPYTYPGYYPAAVPTACRSPAESSGAQGTHRSQLRVQGLMLIHRDVVWSGTPDAVVTQVLIHR